MVGKIKKKHIFSTEKPNKTLPSGYIFQNEHALSHSHNKTLLWVSLIGVTFTFYIFEADTDHRYFGDQIKKKKGLAGAATVTENESPFGFVLQ